MANLFFYDSETTGLPEWAKPSGDECQPHLVQLAGVLVDSETRKIMQSMDLIIKPDGWIIPDETIEIHGITNEKANAIGSPEKSVVEIFLLLCGNADRVAYNKNFDKRIIRIALKRYFSDPLQEDILLKWAEKDSHHCSMKMAKEAIGVKSIKLKDAYKHFTGEPLRGAHTAMADTLASMKVYFAAIDAGVKP